ncbi:hypothetical protein E1B28_007995 [Marasmius oreades]|uniref:Hydrophobin n=1 Tax=Marasmius oreades TaxID=181124 RepID=A0A9P7S336_9AGAR|nr:uncharacterized protein E1B28_007995 [Marasmius oreades]KAG7094395.1 hypothetical protein E1B28_007995 [Marasmius oreades]
MLFNKFFALSSLTAVTTAMALPGGGGGGAGTGTQCCQQVQQASAITGATKTLLGLLGVDLDNITGLVGLNCSPITVVGSGNGACSSGTTAVNCTDNSYGNLVHLGCVLVNA